MKVYEKVEELERPEGDDQQAQIDETAAAEAQKPLPKPNKQKGRGGYLHAS